MDLQVLNKEKLKILKVFFFKERSLGKKKVVLKEFIFSGKVHVCEEQVARLYLGKILPLRWSHLFENHSRNEKHGFSLVKRNQRLMFFPQEECLYWCVTMQKMREKATSRNLCVIFRFTI